MFGRKCSVLIPLLVSAVLISACSSAPKAPQREAQHHAFSRWTQCIERYSGLYRGPMAVVGQRAYNHCEGYRRDVLAFYPHHLKNQIESLLSERADTITTARVVRTVNGVNLDAYKGANIDTLKNRLREARQADL